MADRAQFMQRLGMTPTPPPATNAVPLAREISLAPMSAQALNKQTEELDRGRLDVSASTSDFSAKIGARPGIPMDMESGIPFMERLRISFQPTPEEEEKALNAAYPGGKVRRNAYGWLIVEKPGKDGRPTDFLVDPIGVDFGDLATIASIAPELAGGAVGALKLGKRAPGVLNAFKTLVGMAAGTAAAGAATDQLVRVAEGEPQRPTETLGRRGAGAALDVAVGGAMGVGAKIATKLVSPLSDIGPRQMNARAAQQYIKDRTGIRLEMTPAEATGSGFLLKSEAQQMNKPGASVPFEDFMRQREKDIAEVQSVIYGGPVPDEEAAMSRAIDSLGAKLAPLEQDVKRAAAGVRSQASDEMTSGVGTMVNKTDLGNSLREKAHQIRDDYRAQRDALYNVVESDPRTQVKNISGDDLANEADRLLGKQVSIQTQTPGPILGPTGKPLPITTEEVLTEFSEPGVIPKVSALQRARGQQFRLDELIRMRRSIDNDIAIGEANPGVKPRELIQLRESLTRRIVSGLDAIDPKLRQEWQKANDFVADNVGRFKKKGIAELFRDAEQGSYLGETALVDRVTGGGTAAQDLYRSYREFYGKGSQEMRGVQQAIRDEVFGRDRIEGYIDSKGFARRITQLAKDAPDAFDDAFGSTAASLRNSARAMEASKGVMLDEEELVSAVNSGNLSGRTLQEMLAAQSKKNAAYRNQLVKELSEGNVNPDTIKPTEVVSRFVFDERTQPKDLETVVALLQDRQDVLEDLRRLTFKKVLDGASVLSRSTGSKTIVAEDIEKLIVDENAAKRLRTALGTRTFDDLVALKDFLIPGQLVQSAAKSAGGMQTGAQIAAITETGALSALDRAAKNFVIATIYTSPKLRAYFSNNIFGPQEQALAVNLAIASTPFVEAAINELGREGAKGLVSAAHQATQGYVASQQQSTNAAPAPSSREQFMRRLGAPAQ